jgi:hypothetical protein
MEEKLPKATHTGTLKIGNINIPCAVLDDAKRTRILSEHGVTSAMRSRSGASKRIKKIEQEKGRAPLPVFMAPDKLKPFISEELRIGLLNPIKYRIGTKMAQGFPAELLPQICDVWLKAREAGKIQSQQQTKARQAEILMRGFAHVGIIALVDEETGFQEDRDREALQAILDKFLRDHLAKWAKTFPDEFYEHLFKLKGWQYRPLSVKRPGVVGHWTNDIIYARLAPGVLAKLREKTPKVHKGRRRHKFFQWLTDDYGHPALKQHLSNVIFLMKAYTKWDQFYRALQRAAPKYGDRFLPHIHNDIDE